jgi:hypothetical protein
MSFGGVEPLPCSESVNPIGGLMLACADSHQDDAILNLKGPFFGLPPFWSLFDAVGDSRTVRAADSPLFQSTQQLALPIMTKVAGASATRGTLL